jgi:hypothetical protein
VPSLPLQLEFPAACSSSHSSCRMKLITNRNYYLIQGTLTEGEGSVPLTSSLLLLVLIKVNNVFSIKRSRSKPVNTRRSIVLSLLPLREDSLPNLSLNVECFETPQILSPTNGYKSVVN